jgi:hypothetical protein
LMAAWKAEMLADEMVVKWVVWKVVWRAEM